MRQKSELRPSQNDVITFLYEHDEGIVVMRPGMGKTVSALTAISELLRDNVIRHALVAAPKRVARSVWPDEIKEWEHLSGLSYAVLDGGPANREHVLSSVHWRNITIVGLDVMEWLLELLNEVRPDHPLFDLLVIDEVSKLRDPTGVRAKALAKMADRWKMIWGLSGTLRPSGSLDLFMPARIVTRGKLWGKSFYKWQRPRFYPTDYGQHEWKALPGVERKLNRDLAPLVCIPAVPRQSDAAVVLDRVDLPSMARRNYNEMHRKLATRGVLAASAAVATGKLAQIANGFIYNDGTTEQIHAEKYEWLSEVIENAAGPTLLIYEYLEDLRTMRELLGYTLPVLGVGTPDAQTRGVIDAWNRRELPFLAMHPASGGHGLNLQHGGADMAWFSPCWSAEMWEQTLARINRSGQTEQVIVRVCVANDTVDDMKLDRVHHKMTAQEAFENYLRRFQFTEREYDPNVALCDDAEFGTNP